MSDRFVAIPVGQGDAFYLERGDWSVLVDGGGNKGKKLSVKETLPHLFVNATAKQRVSVLVCTHNDADHANGVLGFLEASLHCDEVWLPGRWLDTLPEVLKPTREIALLLERDMHKLRDNFEGRAEASIRLGFEAFADSVDAEALGRETNTESAESDANGWPEGMVALLEKSQLRREHEFGRHWLAHRSMDRDDFFGDAMAAAVRIRVIAQAAFHRKIPVRWFEHNPTSPVGGTPELTPVNARQIKPVIRVAAGGDKFLAFLALTVANKESLVFCSPGNDVSPAVLFTADSDLAKTTIPRGLNHAIVTAPHHGSDSNIKAYGVVKSACGASADSLTWVRSDFCRQSRPGLEFLKQPKRFCTVCRQSFTRFSIKDAVHLSAESGVWCSAQATCSCK